MEIYGNLSVANPVCRTSQKCVNTSWKRLQDVLKTSLQDVLKTSWIYLEDVLQDVLKTSSRLFKEVLARRFENILATRLEIFIFIAGE